MEADEVVKEGKELSPLFDYGATNPVAMAPTASLVKGKPDEASVPLKNPKHEHFCQLMAYADDMGRHRSAYEAYMIAFRKDGETMEPATARVNASRLRKTHPEVDARITFLDQELKQETMLHKGAIFAETINEVAGVMRAMSHQRNDPKAANTLVNAAKLLIDATGNAAPTRTETEVQGMAGDALGNVRAVLAKVISTTKVVDG